MADIHFTPGKSYVAVGRNGASKQIGVNVFHRSVSGITEIVPINSKGGYTNCSIDIDPEKTGEVCLALLKESDRLLYAFIMAPDGSSFDVGCAVIIAKDIKGATAILSEHIEENGFVTKEEDWEVRARIPVIAEEGLYAFEFYSEDA